MTEKKLTGEIKGKAAAVKERVSAAKKEINKRVTQKAKPAAPNTVTTNRLKLLVTVVARKKAEFYADLIQSFDVNMQMIGHKLLSTDKFGYLLPFEAVSVLLLACIIGGITIARKR